MSAASVPILHQFSPQRYALHGDVLVWPAPPVKDTKINALGRLFAQKGTGVMLARLYTLQLPGTFYTMQLHKWPAAVMPACTFVAISIVSDTIVRGSHHLAPSTSTSGSSPTT